MIPIIVYSFTCLFLNSICWAIGLLIWSGIGVLIGLLNKSESFAHGWAILTHVLSFVFWIWAIIGWWYGITHMTTAV
jgi:hypothetical protein